MQFSLDARTTFAKYKLPDEPTTEHRRRAKIFSGRLPQDFFANRISGQSEQKSRPLLRETIQTHKIKRKSTITQRITSTRDLPTRRGSLSARVGKQDSSAYNLMMDILQTTRKMNRSIDRHSMEMKKQIGKVNPELQTLELPPLRLKKGVSLT